MKDYSQFVYSAYIFTFTIIVVFSIFTLWQFYRTSKKLNGLTKKQDGKKVKK